MKKFDHNVAQNYEVDIRKKVPGYELCHEFIASLLEKDKKNPLDFLVVGPGTGEEFFHLAHLNRNWKFTGVEASEAMVKIARSKIQEQGLEKQIEIIHSRLENYSVDKKYDYVLSILVSHFIPFEEKESFFKRLSELLKKEGKLIVFDLFQTSDFLHEGWLRWSFKKGLTEEESLAMRKNVQEKFFPMSVGKFEELLLKVDLTLEECFIQCLGMHGMIIKRKPSSF